jgi:hypothetical protein
VSDVFRDNGEPWPGRLWSASLVVRKMRHAHEPEPGARGSDGISGPGAGGAVPGFPGQSDGAQRFRLAAGRFVVDLRHRRSDRAAGGKGWDVRDRYEGKGHGHSFGATHSGITEKNRPVLDAFPTEWTDAFEAFELVCSKTGMARGSVRQCINALLRHGHIERRPSKVGTRGEWLAQEHRRRS